MKESSHLLCLDNTISRSSINISSLWGGGEKKEREETYIMCVNVVFIINNIVIMTFKIQWIILDVFFLSEERKKFMLLSK